MSPIASIMRKRFRKRSLYKEIQGYIFLIISTFIVCVIFYLVISKLYIYNTLYESITGVNIRVVECFDEPTSQKCKGIDYEDLINMNKTLLAEMKDQNSSFLTTDTLTIFIVLTVGFFLVQVFLKLYRYNMNMASFYRSLADAFLILQMEKGSFGGVKFDSLVHLLLPKYISLETPEYKGSLDLSAILGKEKKG